MDKWSYAALFFVAAIFAGTSWGSRNPFEPSVPSIEGDIDFCLVRACTCVREFSLRSKDAILSMHDNVRQRLADYLIAYNFPETPEILQNLSEEVAHGSLSELEPHFRNYSSVAAMEDDLESFLLDSAKIRTYQVFPALEYEQALSATAALRVLAQYGTKSDLEIIKLGFARLTGLRKPQAEHWEIFANALAAIFLNAQNRTRDLVNEFTAGSQNVRVPEPIARDLRECFVCLLAKGEPRSPPMLFSVQRAIIPSVSVNSWKYLIDTSYVW